MSEEKNCYCAKSKLNASNKQNNQKVAFQCMTKFTTNKKLKKKKTKKKKQKQNQRDWHVQDKCKKLGKYCSV